MWSGYRLDVKMCFLPKQPFIAFSLYQFLLNSSLAEPSTADLLSLPKGFLSASLKYFALHCMRLELTKKLQHSQITTLCLRQPLCGFTGFECHLGRRQATEDEKGKWGVTTANLTKPANQHDSSVVSHKPHKHPAANCTRSVLQAEPVCSPGV